ncbi:uncharacterized protein SAPINGB_P006323 [Magnusiomyces paraingens]|uniref:MHD domain-containing protein n=1 Tax=Magnusiomyces paraingens TaxID=2606893 RepID=A0A5E8CBG0_9ASCO|nr:uncharacterized protein SAPINGB_P006323 [Saprochaete ingens]VVT58666.1 unnamed protein product [Saprochaete ingens]
MISAIIIYNLKGEVLISRLYRDGLRRSIADVFRIQVISNPDSRSPVLTLGSTSFLHIRHENLYIVGITRSNVDAGLVFEFLYKLVDLGKSYFGTFDENVVKNGFALIYELLDEVLDFGFPQNTEIETLKRYITTEGLKTSTNTASSVVNLARIGKKDDSSSNGNTKSKGAITTQATSATPWRRPGIKYRKNEVFVDIFEDLNLLMSATGSVIKADVAGRVMLKTHLSGQPECKFGLNDSLTLNTRDVFDDEGDNDDDDSNIGHMANAGAVKLEDCQFHQCVRLDDFDSDRIISFIPPDGEFELMRYRAVENINLPFRVIAQVTEVGRLKVDYEITVRANFGAKLYATDVVVHVPTPLNTTDTTCSTSGGKAKYDPAVNQIVWRVGRCAGGAEYSLRASAQLTSTTVLKPWTRPPISMDFSLSMFTSSGIMVRYLKIFEKANYATVKWVRYLVRAGSYEIRY